MKTVVVSIKTNGSNAELVTSDDWVPQSWAK